MNNPIFNAFSNGFAPNNVMEQVRVFRQEMQGKNPHEEINKLLQSGAINQNQLNQAQQMAQGLQMMFK